MCESWLNEDGVEHREPGLNVRHVQSNQRRRREETSLILVKGRQSLLDLISRRESPLPLISSQGRATRTTGSRFKVTVLLTLPSVI